MQFSGNTGIQTAVLVVGLLRFHRFKNGIFIMSFCLTLIKRFPRIPRCEKFKTVPARRIKAVVHCQRIPYFSSDLDALLFKPPPVKGYEVVPHFDAGRIAQLANSRYVVFRKWDNKTFFWSI